MGSIWAFCLQTLTVTLAAALLLLVKRLLADKLSPRWQYGVWVLLALRALIPAKLGRRVVISIGVWLETGKAMAEAGLDSAYSAVYTPISLDHVFPRIGTAPRSVTDWLFVIYVAGAIALALRYLISYTVLRLRLRRGEAPNAAVTEAMARVCEKYGLKPCRVVAVPGLESAFVCGVWKPVLAVPAGAAVDDKVILHELLHLKYGDIPQGIFWAALRCLHWCNPVLHYVFDRIGNDMESLCDQRVLERLEGEERREYGGILLSMASRRYARTPGTGSISNGGKNISRRIGAIVRFKKYPRGMSLVSGCIVLVLVSPLLIGTASAVSVTSPQTEAEVVQAMAQARVYRCGTVAGAIDTYAKGLEGQNITEIAMASPLDTHKELAAQLNQEYGNWRLDLLDEGVRYVADSEYGIYDLVKNADGSYNARLVFSVSATEGYTLLLIPLRIFREGESWVVEQRGEQTFSGISDGLLFMDGNVPMEAGQTVSCGTGTVTVRHQSGFSVGDTDSSRESDLRSAIDPDAQFQGAWTVHETVWQMDPETEITPRYTAALLVWRLDTEADMEKARAEAESTDICDIGGNTSGSSGKFFYTSVEVTSGWDGKITASGGSGYWGSGIAGEVEALTEPPAGYLVRVAFDGEVVEEILIEGETHE